MNTEEKLLFKQRYDEISYEDMELEACYELMKEKIEWDSPIEPDELLDELEEWVSYKGFAIERVCLNLEETICFDDWNEIFNNLEEFLQTNIESFTEYVECEYEGTDIDEALEDEDIIEEFLNEAIISENYDLITINGLKSLQNEVSVYLLENYADDYMDTENYLCVKNFQYTIS